MKKISIAVVIIFTGIFTQAQNCPAIQVNAAIQVTAGDTLIFSADVRSASSSLTYNWTISAGTIMSGQGTSTIYVNTEGLGGMYVTATVELGGIPRDCVSTSSSTVEIQNAPEKIISANYTTPQALAAAIKKFITQTNLKNLNISQTAFVYVYKGATTTTAQLKAINTAIAKEFEKNGVLSFQYKIVHGGKKKIASFEIYKQLPENGDPKPSK